MLLTSTQNPDLRASWRDAVLAGLAPEGGLYFPITLPSLSEHDVAALRELSFPDLCFELSKAFLGGEVEHTVLRSICDDAFSFPAPLHRLSSTLSVLELFHGPTCAFKDFGARFMSRLFRHFWEDETRPLTVLVATSGDTGSAVANAFFDPIPNSRIRVAVLFPKGKVSLVQEKQMTTLGGNVTAYEVDGTFDDCQRLVKQALADPEIRRRTALTSANSINIARLLPQMFYYVYASLRHGGSDLPLVSVPSGNLGNLTGGLMAKMIGAPLGQFIAALNDNKIFGDYLSTGRFSPQPSVETISNAMDVGNPSNFARISTLFSGSLATAQAHISAFSVSEEATLGAIRSTYEATGYVLDPHTAVGVAALERYRKQHPSTRSVPGIGLSTAHPAKFSAVVRRAIGIEPKLPPQLAEALEAQAVKVPLGNCASELRGALVKQP